MSLCCWYLDNAFGKLCMHGHGRSPWVLHVTDLDFEAKRKYWGQKEVFHIKWQEKWLEGLRSWVSVSPSSNPTLWAYSPYCKVGVTPYLPHDCCCEVTQITVCAMQNSTWHINNAKVNICYYYLLSTVCESQFSSMCLITNGISSLIWSGAYLAL